MANNSVSFAVLDPDTYKQNLITYLKSQSIFKDYDFSGSTINVLLDILSYNTYQNAFYMNMIFSESFIDSAVLKNSVISKIKEIGYIPRSMKSSEAIVSLQVQTSNSLTFEIPKGTVFSGVNSNSSYQFITNENYVYLSSNGYFNIPSLTIYDGFYNNDGYIVDWTNEVQTFDLTSTSIDIDSLSISLIENGNTYILNQANTILDLNSNSYVYFLQATFDDKYTLVFGDGITGHKPINGSIIQATYRVCSGPSADGVLTFILSDDLSATNNTVIELITVTTVANSVGGSLQEDINSIKFNAINSSQTQGRAVTSSDYKQLIKDNFGYIRDVNVYGGTATAISVDYGKVFICCINTDGNYISDSQKDDIISFIKARNTQGISPYMTDPDNILLDVSVTLHVDMNKTTLSISDYQSLVTNNIISFANTNLDKFGSIFRYSKLTDTIDNSDQFILSNETNVITKKEIEIPLNINYSFNVNFYNQLNIGSVYSSSFIMSGITYFITDSISNNNPDGTLYLVNQATPSLFSKIGTVDYINGIITTKQLIINNYNNNPGVVFYVSTVSKDIYSYYNNIINIVYSTINVKVLNN